MIYLKGVFILKTKSIYHNTYAILKQKPRYRIFSLCFFFLFLFFVISLFLYKIQTVYPFEGVYDCSKDICTIKTVLSYKEAKKIKNDSFLYLDKEKIPLRVKEFGNVFVEGSVAFQNLIIEVPKQKFYLKETVEVKLIQKEENLITILLNSLKGGEKNE